MVQLTARDEAMLEWLRSVRMADTEAIRWALPAMPNGRIAEPVHLRKAQRWVARMFEVGLIGRGRLSSHGNYIAWPSHHATGRPGPNLFRQTTRHELAVALASARYLTRGYGWTRDRRPVALSDHQADGVALGVDGPELIEVELTPKTLGRYRGIFHSHAERLTSGGIARVVYLGTDDATRIVLREADQHLFRDLRPRVVAVPVFNVFGEWVGADDAPWAQHLMVPAPTLQPAPELWREGIA